MSRSAKTIILTPAASIRPRSVRWFVRDRVPLGAVTLLAGEPGQGKSTLAIDWVARASRGQLEGDLHGQSIDVALVTAEDAIAEVVCPRLEAAGADLERVRIVSVVQDGVTGGLVLPDDIDQLGTVLGTELVQAVVIDPIVAHLSGELNSHRDQDVRRALAPLARLAETYDLAVIAICHLNKGEAASALAKVAGSVGFVGAARSVLILAPDPDDEDGPTRILAHAKCNYGPLAPSQRLRVEGREITDDDGVAISTSGIAWLGEAPGLNAFDLVAAKKAAVPADVLTKAMDEICDALSGGRRTSDDMEQERTRRGCSHGVWKKARQRLGIKPEKDGFQGTWYWSLPKDAHEDAHRPEVSAFGTFGENGHGHADKRRQDVKDGRLPKDGHFPKDEQLAVTDAEESAFGELIGAERELGQGEPDEEFNL
jgi:hypothetical protein